MGAFYDIIPQGKGHYRIGGKEEVFMDLFVGTEKALLLDTGYGYGNLKEQISEITELPLIIVNTHGHLDHVCGNYRFEETVYIHEKDIELCKAHTGVEHRKGMVANAKHYTDHISGTISNILQDDFDEDAYIHGGTGKLVAVKEGDSFSLGGITMTVYEVPGHTPGSIALLWEEEKILFVGDAMNPFVWLFGEEALTLADYKATLAKAYAMDFNYFYISHNPARMDKEQLLDYIDAAENVDFEKGFHFEIPFDAGVEARICPREGYGPQDFDKPGFASVVISREHL